MCTIERSWFSASKLLSIAVIEAPFSSTSSASLHSRATRPMSASTGSLPAGAPFLVISPSGAQPLPVT
jgi:hypothetical protein